MTRVRVYEQSERSPGRVATNAALDLAARLPRLVLEARRVAATLAHGIHGRRRAGPGESFWQFRPFVSGETASNIDWRRSARDDKLYVREREWEAAHSVWLWIDRSASMGFASDLAQASKAERALVLGLALADHFVEAGERVGLLGMLPPRASRRIIERFAEAISAHAGGLDEDLPPTPPLSTLDEAMIISDFLSPLDKLEDMIGRLASRGARGHVVMIVDPVEETFPFTGQAVLDDVEGGPSLRVGDAGSWGDAYRRGVAAHREALLRCTRSRGWTMTIHRTDRPASEAALRLVTLVASARTAQVGPQYTAGG